MSRSYKKVLGWKVGSPSDKRLANQKVRRTKEVPNGGAYRKIYESYDICDQKCLYYTWAEFMRREEHDALWHEFWGITLRHTPMPWKAWRK